MPQTYIELAIGSDPAAFEAYIGLMAEEGFNGFWEDGGVLRAYIQSGKWSGSRLSELQLRLAGVASALALPPPSIAATRVQEKNWNKAWESTIRPIRVTDHIVIAPTWHPHKPRPGDIVLTIDPKMSFGTGYHESTRLMLALLEKHLLPGARVLDVGTGTGVLAIAAIKLGAASALGVDNDEWSYDNAKENAGLNGLTGQFAVRRGDLSAVHEAGFDLILVNIQKDVIEKMLTGLAAHLAQEGRLLMSGLLHADRDALVSSLRASGLKVIGEQTDHDWIAFAAVRF